MVKKSVLGGYHKSVGFQAGSQLDFQNVVKISNFRVQLFSFCVRPGGLKIGWV
jgi:hypothetical protein